MNKSFIVAGCLLLGVASALFVRLQLQKETSNKSEALLGLSIILSGATGLMVLIAGIYP